MKKTTVYDIKKLIDQRLTEVDAGMKKAMYGISAGACILTLLSVCIYYFWGVAAAKPVAITFGTTGYHFLMRLTVGIGFDKFMNNKANYLKKWYQSRAWEQKLYECLRVKKWKNRLPSYNADYFDPTKHSWEEIVQAMCQAELVHEVIIALSFVPILLAYWFGELFVFIITSLVAALIDMLFVMMQRYNRPRVMRLINKKMQ